MITNLQLPQHIKCLKPKHLSTLSIAFGKQQSRLKIESDIWIDGFLDGLIDRSIDQFIGQLILCCAVQELPSTVGKLKLLSILNVDRNRLSLLPCEVRYCAWHLFNQRLRIHIHLALTLNLFLSPNVLKVCTFQLTNWVTI